MKTFSAIFIAIAFFIFAGPVSSAVPSTVTHQGYLEDSGGSRVNGPVNMGFAIYSVESGGTALWTETQTVQVVSGIYAVALGAVNPIDPAIIDGNLWLGVTVGADTEMSPRQKLGAVPFALKAASAEAVSSAMSQYIKTANNAYTLGCDDGAHVLVGGGIKCPGYDWAIRNYPDPGTNEWNGACKDVSLNITIPPSTIYAICLVP